MPTEVKDAMKNLKTIGNELTVWENRLEVAKSEAHKLSQTKDALQAEIDRKTSDFNIYMSQRDAEVKKSRADMLVARDQLSKDKAEFMGIVKAHQEAKANLESEKHLFEIQKAKHLATIQNVQEFIS